MSMIFITCILHCCTQVRTPQREWTDQDKKTLDTAREHCYKEKECLIKFRKIEDSVYEAICGRDNN